MIQTNTNLFVGYSDPISTEKKREREASPEITTEKTKEVLKKNKLEPSSVETKKKFKFVYDQYTEVRGDPQMLEITCKKCHSWLIDYQKDGPGNLLRCYVDRIYHPRALRERKFTKQTVANTQSLKCQKCGITWAKPIIYQRKYPKEETRPAYIILKDRNNPLIEYHERKK